MFRWKGTFHSKFIEEITHRTGNYKPFNTFVKMLVSAFDGDSPAVSLDLLTSEDLDALRQASGLSTRLTHKQTHNNTTHSKRYMILTYQGEFDRVYYPMALHFCDQDNVPELKKTIVSLREEIESLHRALSESGKSAELGCIELRLQAERDQLRCEAETSANELARLGANLHSLRDENHLLKTKIEVLESQLEPKKRNFVGARDIRHPTSNASTNSLRIPIRSRTSSLAVSPANSVRASPQRKRLSANAFSPIRGISPKRSDKPVPFQKAQSRRRSPLRRDVISPRRHMEAHPSSFTSLPVSVEISKPSQSAPVAFSEVDARLEALQNFLRYQKGPTRV